MLCKTVCAFCLLSAYRHPFGSSIEILRPVCEIKINVFTVLILKILSLLCTVCQNRLYSQLILCKRLTYRMLIKHYMSEPRQEKTCLWDFWPGKTQTSCSTKEASKSHEIANIETKYIRLSRQHTTKVLIRLRRCVGWSAPLLFAYGITGFLLTWLIFQSPLGQTESDWYSGGHRAVPQVHISFVEIWSWNNFYSHSVPTADSSRTVVRYWQKYGYLVLVNRLGSLPRNSG